MNAFPSTLLPQTNDPKEIQKAVLDLLKKLNLVASISGKAIDLSKQNPVLGLAQIGYETDTISLKIGDGKTRYNDLIYFYRGLPVPGEPSLGTGHITSDANRSAATVVSTSVNTAGVWSAAVTMPNVPAGAKVAYCWADIVLAGAAAGLTLNTEAATGYTLSDTTVGVNFVKYEGIITILLSQSARGIIKVHLDASGQFRWCSSSTNAAVHIYSPIDYDM